MQPCTFMLYNVVRLIFQWVPKPFLNWKVSQFFREQMRRKTILTYFFVIQSISTNFEIIFRKELPTKRQRATWIIIASLFVPSASPISRNAEKYKTSKSRAYYCFYLDVNYRVRHLDFKKCPAASADTDNLAVTVQANSTTVESRFNSSWFSALCFLSPSEKILPKSSRTIDVEGSECSNIGWLENLQNGNGDQPFKQSDRKIIFNLIDKVFSKKKNALRS